MTGRFHRSWADWGGLKHPDALRFECGGILAAGGAVSVGDQLHPSGRLNSAVYEVIGEAFREVEAVEPYCLGAVAAAQVAVLVVAPGDDRAIVGAGGSSAEGAAKILLELHHQFDVITDQSPDFERYDLLVIPDHGPPLPALVQRLRAYLAAGGRLLLSHRALLDEAAGTFALADEMGVDYLGRAASVPDYFEITDPALLGPVTRPHFAYSLYEGPAMRVAPRPGTARLAEAVESYFNRDWQRFSSHGFTPPRPEAASYPAVTQQDGVIYLAGPVFAAYQIHGNLTFRALVEGCLHRLLPHRLVETDAPATAEVSLLRQASRDVVHVVNYHAGRRASGHVEALEAPVPLHDVTVRLLRAPPTTRVHLARAQVDLPFQAGAGRVTVTVPRVDAHELVVFESGPEP
jgi:hypothetical protein